MGEPAEHGTPDDTPGQGPPEEHPDHPHGGPPGQTGEHPQGGPPGQQPDPDHPIAEPPDEGEGEDEAQPKTS